HPRRHGLVLASVGRQPVRKQLLRVLFGQVGSAVVFVVARAPALHNQSLAALVEYLRHASHELVTSYASEEADPDITGGQVRRLSSKTPRHAAGLVIQCRVKIPGRLRLILQAPTARAPYRRCAVRIGT